MRCAFCQSELTFSDRPGKQDVCSSCGRDIHCCYQCHFYDENAHHQCREPQADYVAEKDQANFCDYFRFDPQVKIRTPNKEALKAKLDALFKKK